MIVVAGPPGSGKTSAFPVTGFGVDAFNIDDRCAQVLGSYRAIPREVRRSVAHECERFVDEHIVSRRPFAVETTLRTVAAIDQARLARIQGFATELIFIATDSIAENAGCTTISDDCQRFHTFESAAQMRRSAGFSRGRLVMRW